MTTLILPVAGQSSRFPDMRPKWLLTMPSRALMIEESVKGLEIEKYSRIIIVCLREHLDKYVSLEKLEFTLKENIRNDIEFCILDEPTSCHAETVSQALTKMDVNDGFYLKDCDNYFEEKCLIGNEISVVNLNNVGLMDAKNKSYVRVEEGGLVTNIVEKNVISNLFCCGGYSFSDAKEFLFHYQKIKNFRSSKEVYISHVIYSMLTTGVNFRINEASHYIDFGTQEEYRKFCAQFMTIFCDIDGVLLENGSKFGANGWRSKAIESNIKILSELQSKERIYLVLTTSRPDSEEEYVRGELLKFGLRCDKFIGGLPHAKRVLINDFSPTNPYPTSIAINLQRNSTELSQMLTQLVS